MAEIETCSSQSASKNRAGLEICETNSYNSSQLQRTKVKGKGIACKRRNPRVSVRRTRGINVAAIGFPLGMSVAAVMAQVNGTVKALIFKVYCLLMIIVLGDV